MELYFGTFQLQPLYFFTPDSEDPRGKKQEKTKNMLEWLHVKPIFSLKSLMEYYIIIITRWLAMDLGIHNSIGLISKYCHLASNN